MSSVVDLYRSKDGHVIHRHDCRHAASGVRWNWADDKSPDEVFATVVGTPRLRPCCQCLASHKDLEAAS